MSTTGTDLLKSYISGVSFRVGPTAPIEELFPDAPEGDTGVEFFKARGLKNYCAQIQSTADMCATVIRDSLQKSSVSPGEIGAVVVDGDNGHCADEDQIQILEGLRKSGISRVPVIGVGLQTCGGSLTAIDVATRVLRTSPSRKPVLVLICARATGLPRADVRRATILSDGVSACIVSTTPGCFELLAMTSTASLDTVRTGPMRDSSAVALVRSCGEIAAVTKLLYDNAGTEPKEIEVLFVTNGNLLYTSFAARATGVDSHRVYSDNVPNYGHVFSCDHLINLVTYGTTSRFIEGGKYLLIGWSPYMFSGAILSYVGAST